MFYSIKICIVFLMTFVLINAHNLRQLSCDSNERLKPNDVKSWLNYLEEKGFSELEETDIFVVDFSPLLSARKRYALRTAGYTSATKVVLAFETPFWETATVGKRSKGGATFTDLAIKQVYYPQLGHNTNSCENIF